MLRADLRLYRYKYSFKRHRTRANVQTFKLYIQVEPQLLRAIEPELRPYQYVRISFADPDTVLDKS